MHYSEEVALIRVQQNGYSIKFIHNPSEAVCMAAVQKQKLAIRYIVDPQMVKISCDKLGIEFKESFWIQK